MDNKIEKLMRSRIRSLKTEGIRTVDFETRQQVAKGVPIVGRRFLILDSENGVVAGAGGGLSEQDLERWLFGAGSNLLRKILSDKFDALYDRALRERRTG